MKRLFILILIVAVLIPSNAQICLKEGKTLLSYYTLKSDTLQKVFQADKILKLNNSFNFSLPEKKWNPQDAYTFYKNLAGKYSFKNYSLPRVTHSSLDNMPIFVPITPEDMPVLKPDSTYNYTMLNFK